jgi:HlyD family secretion protein
LLLEDTMVRAPMDGIVLDVIAKEGQMTDAEGVVLMGDVDHMNVVAEIHEEDVAHVRIGQPALLTPDGTKDVLRGKVLSIGRMIRAAKLFPNDPKKHQDIRIVEVTISVPRHEALQALVHRKVHVRIGSVKA